MVSCRNIKRISFLHTRNADHLWSMTTIHDNPGLWAALSSLPRNLSCVFRLSLYSLGSSSQRLFASISGVVSCLSSRDGPSCTTSSEVHVSLEIESARRYSIYPTDFDLRYFQSPNSAILHFGAFSEDVRTPTKAMLPCALLPYTRETLLVGRTLREGGG